MSESQETQIHNDGDYVTHGTSIVGSHIKAGNVIINSPASVAPKNPSLKQLWTVPYSRDRHFVSRQEIFDEISAKIENGEPVVLCGLGGAGKSQIAIECAERFRTQYHDSYVLWLSAISTGNLLDGFDVIARRLNLMNSTSTSPSCVLVADWLNGEDAQDKKCLMIIDNLDTFSMLDQSLKGSTATCKTNVSILEQCVLQQLNPSRRLLYTTRNRDIAASIRGSDSWIDVGCLYPAESLALFKSRLAARKDIITDERTLEELASALEHVPLAITQAAAFMTRNKITARKYLAAIQSGDSKMTSYLTTNLPDNRRIVGSQNSIFLTWQLSFEEIMKTDASASHLLSILSMLATSRIARRILHDGLTSDEVHTQTGIGTLEAYCLLKSNDDDSVQVHSLIAVAVRAWLQSSGMFSSYAEKAALLIASKFPSWDKVRDDPSVWREELSMLSPHADTVVRNHVITKSSFTTCSELLRCLASYEIYLGRYDSASEHAQLLYKAQIQFAEKHHIIKLQTTSILTNLLIRRSQFSQAELEQRRALSEFESVLAPSDGEILRAQWLLAIALKEQDELEEAEKICLTVCDRATRHLGREDFDLAKFHSTLAEIYERQGEYSKALDSQRSAYVWILSVHGENHHMTVLNKGNMARLQKRLGNGTAAITQCREAHSKMTMLEGDKHPATILCAWWLAFMLAEDQHYEEAESLYIIVAKTMELVWGPTHPDLNRCQQQLMAVKSKTFHLNAQEFNTNDSTSGIETNPNQEHTLRNSDYLIHRRPLNRQMLVHKTKFTVGSGAILHTNSHSSQSRRHQKEV